MATSPDRVETRGHKGYDFTARNAIKRYWLAREVVGGPCASISE